MHNLKITLLLSLSIILLSPFSLFAQDSFKYQAVVRNNTGDFISNQMVGVKVSIIQLDESMPATYEELHAVESNTYGVINLSIGEGIPSFGEFNNMNWNLKSFIKIEIDANGGTDYTISNLTEILSVPRAMYAETSGSVRGNKMGMYVTDFGAVGDGETDDTAAFQTALDSAHTVACKLFVPIGIYKITETLMIKDGVSLIGEGPGSEPLQTPYNGSLIWYDGDDWAVKVVGHNSRVKDLVIKDISGGQAKGGISIEADGRLVESIFLFEVMVSGFTEGTGLQLSALESGGIAYASINNVRIRHGKIGIHLIQDNSSFVNSNTWNHCQVSGGGFEYGMLIEGGNNNIFNGLIIEPPSTEKGHLLVEKGEIFGSEIRIEGTQQEQEIPLIEFAKKTKNSTVNGVYAGGLTLDKGNNLINMKSGKAIHYKNSSFNKFQNSTFFSPDGQSISDWEIIGNDIEIEVLPPELSETNNVVKITIPKGKTVDIEPSALARPAVKDLPLYDQVNFGFHIKTDTPKAVYVSTNAPKGWTNSNPHSGSNEWEFVGMNAEVNRSNPAIFRAQINNTTNKDLEVYITTPVLTFGNQLPVLEETPLFTSGGKLTGQLSHALATVSAPQNGFLTLPVTANYFELTSSTNIQRINHETKDRVPKGTVITLLFNHKDVGVANSGYINLKSGYNSVENGSLTLISNGNGTWREVDRNN